MDTEWSTVKIDNLGKVVTGKTPPTADPENYGGELPFITPSDMKGQKYIDRTERTISAKGRAYVKNLVIPPNTVFVSCIGSDMGKVGMTKVESVTNQQINSIIARDGVDPNYIYYNLFSRKDELQRLATSGSAQPILNKGHFSQLEVPLPLFPEQKAIAHILGSLDDKIELNRRMNETLEAMARAVFKSWFVDFDPIPGLGPHREWQDSPLGRIPKGWQVAELGDITDVIDCLHSKKPERQRVGKPLLQLWNIRDDGLIDMSDTYWIAEDDYNLWISRIEASPGDCVVTNVGRVGAVAQISQGLCAALGRNMTAIRCKKAFSYPTFLIECLLSSKMKEEILHKTDTGTILNALNVKNIPKLRFIMPSHPIGELFEKACHPMRARMEHNLSESRTLAAIRDALLPKLLSGEIRV